MGYCTAVTTNKLHYRDLEESHKHVEQKKPDAKKVLTVLFHVDQVQNQTKLDCEVGNQDSSFLGGASGAEGFWGAGDSVP